MKWEDRYVDGPDYTIKDDVVFVLKNFVQITLFRKIDDKRVQVSFDRRVVNFIKREILHLIKHDVEFEFISPMMFDPKFMRRDYDIIYRENLRNMLENYRFKTFFLFFKKHNINFMSKLVIYVNETDTHQIFDEEFDKVNKSVQKAHQDWFYNGPVTYLDSEEIRDFFSSFKRNMKLTQILL